MPVTKDEDHLARRRRLIQLWQGLAALTAVAGAILLFVGLFSYFQSGDSGSDTASQEDGWVPGTGPGLTDDPSDPRYSTQSGFSSRRVGTVRLDIPQRIKITAADVDAPVTAFGLDKDRLPEVPESGEYVAWYDFSSIPGTGDNAVFAGHVDWGGEAAVFNQLGELKIGDLVRLVNADGSQLTYGVVSVFRVDPEDSTSLQVMKPTGSDMITLITCGGSWIPDRDEVYGGHYENRVIVQAMRVRVPTSSGF